MQQKILGGLKASYTVPWLYCNVYPKLIMNPLQEAGGEAVLDTGGN